MSDRVIVGILFFLCGLLSDLLGSAEGIDCCIRGVFSPRPVICGEIVNGIACEMNLDGGNQKIIASIESDMAEDTTLFMTLSSKPGARDLGACLLSSTSIDLNGDFSSFCNCDLQVVYFFSPSKKEPVVHQKKLVTLTVMDF
jgi:hypothetical protein